MDVQLLTARWFYVLLAGLSSFYSELMKGFGAGARLWELLDRKPEFPLNGQYTQHFIILIYTCACYVVLLLTQSVFV